MRQEHSASMFGDDEAHAGAGPDAMVLGGAMVLVQSKIQTTSKSAQVLSSCSLGFSVN